MVTRDSSSFMPPERSKKRRVGPMCAGSFTIYRKRINSVCIAAATDDHEAIVSCVDTRVSTATTSFDPVVGRKICGFRGWTTLTSGTLSDADALIDRFQELLSQTPNNDPPVVQ